MIIPLNLSLGEESLNKFNDKINSGYKSYLIIEEKNNQFYDLKIIQGINDDELNFGIYLYSQDPQRLYSIKIIDKGIERELSKSKRGDYSIPAIKHKNDITIYIINDDNVHYQTKIEFSETQTFIKNNQELIIGQNEGLKMTRLTGRVFTLSTLGIVSLVFAVVIIIFGVIIFIFFKRKKGVFSVHGRKENVFNFQDYLDQAQYNQNIGINLVLNENDIEETPTQKEAVYERQRFYEEELEDFIDVEKILKERGFNTDYQNALEFEKNEVMLELMKMRDLKEISVIQYKEEIIKLWKK